MENMSCNETSKHICVDCKWKTICPLYRNVHTTLQAVDGTYSINSCELFTTDAYEKHEALYKKALEKWGYLAQRDMILEEMSELAVKLLHASRSKKTVLQMEVVTELADVAIMVNQMVYAWGAEVEFVKEVDRKLKRLEELLSE
jgi:hypothetical protein